MPLDLTWKLFEKLKRPLGLFLLLIVTSILQHILDLRFVCACRPGKQPNIWLHLALPALILTFVDKIVNIFYKKKFFLTVECCTCKCCCSFIGKTIFELIIVAALWIAMVLFDGDWYFCLRTNSNLYQTELPCKEMLTYEEERIKDSYKTESRDIGLGLCCGLLLVWILAELFRTQCRSCCHRCRRPHFEAKYTKILSDELSSYIKEELKKIAKKKAEQMLKQKIEIIRNHEVPQSNTSPGQVPQSNTSPGQVPQSNVTEEEFSQAWKDISDPKFIFTCQRPARNGVTGQVEIELSIFKSGFWGRRC